MPKQKQVKKQLKPKLIIEEESEENVVIWPTISESNSVESKFIETQTHIQTKFQLEKEKTYLSVYLDSIKGKAREYKRVTISPLRYAGGKSNAVGFILENLPALKEKKIVSLFFGGGTFELVLSKNLGFEVIGYDIFGMLTNFWKQLIEKPKELAGELKKFVADSENYTRNRHILLNYWEKIKPETLVYNTRDRLVLTEEEKTRLDDNGLIQAAYYYYNMQLSYGPMFLGWGSSVYLKPDKYKKIVETIEKYTTGNLKVNQGAFEEIIDKHPDDFLFLDPPYYLGEDSKMFKGMYPNCNFAIHHNNFDHKLLCEKLKKHRGGFLITYNDCTMIKEWYKEYKQVFPEWQYTYGQGEKRIGKNRENNETDNVKESHEIIIVCPPL
jgi:DNA adenine methylase